MAAESLYYIVINDEEQYSIWSADRPPPAGWRTVGNADSRDACLDEIERLWVDMRPASLRRWMEKRESLRLRAPRLRKAMDERLHTAGRSTQP